MLEDRFRITDSKIECIHAKGNMVAQYIIFGFVENGVHLAYI